jgi:hypothetical protein
MGMKPTCRCMRQQRDHACWNWYVHSVPTPIPQSKPIITRVHMMNFSHLVPATPERTEQNMHHHLIYHFAHANCNPSRSVRGARVANMFALASKTIIINDAFQSDRLLVGKLLLFLEHFQSFHQYRVMRTIHQFCF